MHNLWNIGGGQTIHSLTDKIEKSQNQCRGLQAGSGKRRMCWTEICWPEISSYRRVFFNLSSSVTENSEPTHFCNLPTSASKRLFTWVLLASHCTNPPKSFAVWQLNKLSLFAERWRIFNFTNSCTFWWMSGSRSDSQMQDPPRPLNPHFKRAASLWCPCHIISVSEGAAAELIKSWAFARGVAPVLLCKSERLLLGCLTAPWKAYQLVSPRFASGSIIHESLFLNESNQNVVWKKNLHSFPVIHTCRVPFVSAEAFSRVIYYFWENLTWC